ncbi:hypothetical protein BKA59DRAFT_551136 [Fusarium tricinctum]|uniref:Uncharacterized protein n=1 Tax=Fusarium tricinctum TaxID=61284 RepID=A0A8K0SAL1_9HYPO|nr:hypothetical protein BKA59DRAFT_551136 [Fusarium tricinctum]
MTSKINGKKPLDHSKVDPYKIGERRQHMQAVFSHLGLLFKENWRQLVEDSVCNKLDSAGYRNSSIAWFEWEVDKTIWSGVLAKGKIQDPAYQWPWVNEPEFSDLRAGYSPVYREWRTSRKLPVDEVDPAWALKHQVPSKREVSKSGKSKPSSSSAAPKAPEPAAEKKYPESVAAIRDVLKDIQLESKGKKDTAKAKADAKAKEEKAKLATQDKPVATAVVRPPVAETKTAGAQPAKSTGSAKPATQARTSHALVTVKPRPGEDIHEARERRARELATAEKTEKAIEASVLARLEAAKTIFNAEKVKQAEKKAAKAAEAEATKVQEGKAKPDSNSWGDEVENVEENTVLISHPNHSELLRDEFGARNGLVVPPSLEVPELGPRQIIWRGLPMEIIGGPILGHFEVALPPWIDFHDLVYGKDNTFISEVRRDNLLDKDVTISWELVNGRPVSLVIGPNPNATYDPQDRQLWVRVRAVWWKVINWLVYVYRGRCVRLVDWLSIMQKLELVHGGLPSGDVDSLRNDWDILNSNQLKAAYDAKIERQHYDLWAPEIHAILTEPCRNLGELFEEWIGRQGPEFVLSRILAVRGVWARWQAVEAWNWTAEQFEKLSPSVTEAPA